MGALGGTVGLLAGGILTSYAGWRYIFFFNVPIGVAALALSAHDVPESRARGGRRRYDPFGAVSITAALLVFVYAISQAPQAGWAATQTVAMLAGGAALLVAFLVIETRAEAPLLPLPLLRLTPPPAERRRLPAHKQTSFTFVFHRHPLHAAGAKQIKCSQSSFSWLSWSA